MTTTIKQRWCKHHKYPQYVYHEHEVGFAKDHEWMVWYKCGNCDRSAHEYTLDRKSLYKRLSEPTWKPNSKHLARLFYCLVPALIVGIPIYFIQDVLGIIFGITMFWFGMDMTE